MIAKNHPFAGIRRVNPWGGEFWYAREVAPLLDYSSFGDFWSVIKKAERDCRNCLVEPSFHFWHIKERVGALGHKRHWQRDVRLSALGLRSVVMAADLSKPVVSLSQGYYWAAQLQESADRNKQARGEAVGESFGRVDFRGVVGFNPLRRLLEEPPASPEELESFGSTYVMLSKLYNGILFNRPEVGKTEMPTDSGFQKAEMERRAPVFIDPLLL
ncbi:MAG: hypothetical protein HXX08_12850 [Chloroflexi bacterium]|uniref:Uncharacterized protein n=1 Tax=Candidatus Chlorohelix allophototropha TaxID=3003348 RepID=A0A8T7M3V4_9CHLR|nr:hypothetical protein [Chloroflexota bacterium]WJW69976.1 hypothetical protein OZ401_004777 [Chloroflexota bacterium L227-S17]